MYVCTIGLQLRSGYWPTGLSVVQVKFHEFAGHWMYLLRERLRDYKLSDLYARYVSFIISLFLKFLIFDLIFPPSFSSLFPSFSAGGFHGPQPLPHVHGSSSGLHRAVWFRSNGQPHLVCHCHSLWTRYTLPSHVTWLSYSCHMTLLLKSHDSHMIPPPFFKL